MKRIWLPILISFFVMTQMVSAADKAIVYDTIAKKIKTSDPLSIAQGGTGSATQNFVGLTGDQSIAGAKTFTTIPVLPASDPTTDNQAARKAYADTKISKTTAGEIAAMTEKTTLVDDDLFLIEDSAASNAKKKVKKSNVATVIAGTAGQIQIHTGSAWAAGNGLLFLQSTVTTTNNTPTTLQTITIPAVGPYLIEARVTARCTAGDQITQAGAYIIRGAYREGNPPTLLGSVVAEFTGEDQSPWNATLVTSGADVLVQITGATSNTIVWYVTSIITYPTS